MKAFFGKVAITLLATVLLPVGIVAAMALLMPIACILPPVAVLVLYVPFAYFVFVAGIWSNKNG